MSIKIYMFEYSVRWVRTSLLSFIYDIAEHVKFINYVGVKYCMLLLSFSILGVSVKSISVMCYECEVLCFCLVISEELTIDP